MKIGKIVAGMALSIATMAAVAMTPAKAAVFTFNGVTVDCPWTEATAPGVPVASVYMILSAAPGANQQLTAVFSEVATAGEIQSFTRVGGVLTRQRLEYLPVIAGQTLPLLPGGYHLLLVGLRGPLFAGTSIPAWLEFAPAGGFGINIEVVPVGARPSCAPGPSVVTPPVTVFPLPPLWIPRGSF